MLLAAVLLAAPTVCARLAPDAPAAARTPNKIAAPAGYVRVEVAGRVAICSQPDETWVRPALEKASPATRPTTSPADMLTHIAEQRATLKSAILADLGTIDDAAIDALLNDELPKIARDYQAFKTPVVYLVTTRDGVKRLMESGWSDPHFRYNRVTGEVMFDLAIPIAVDGPMDEAVLPALFAPEGTPEKNAGDFATFLSRSETGIAQSVAGRCHFELYSKLGGFVTKNAVEPLKLKPDQAWLGTGLADFFAARYTTMISGVSMLEMIQGLTMNPRGAQMNAASVDLVRPLPVDALRSEKVPAYLDARRRKACAVMYLLSTEGSADAPAKALAALRKTPPADNAALIDAITAATGQNLTKYLAPQ